MEKPGKMFNNWLVKHKRWGVIFWIAIVFVGFCLTTIKVLPSQVSITDVKVVSDADVDGKYALLTYKMKSKSPVFLPTDTTTVEMSGNTIVITPRWKFAPYAPLTNLAQNDNHKQVTAAFKYNKKAKSSKVKVVINADKAKNEVTYALIK